MIYSSVPDVLSFSRFTKITADLKSRVSETSIEAVTGERQDITTAVGGAIGDVHLIRKALDDIENDTRRYALTTGRMEVVSNSLESIRTGSQELGPRALSALTIGDSTSLSVVAEEADFALRHVFSSLKTSTGGRQLFSGDATDTLPLADVETLLGDITALAAAAPNSADLEVALDTYFSDPAGGFQTTIYQGGNGNAAGLILPDNNRVDYGVKADDAAIKDVIRGLAVLAIQGESAFAAGDRNYKEMVETAVSKLSSGHLGIVSLEALQGNSIALIEKAEARQEYEEIALNSAYIGAAGRDQYEAAAELKQLETQLEAAYTLTARLSELTLTNYIR